jgi:hypothetical protein
VGNFVGYAVGQGVGGFVGYVGREILTDGTVRALPVGILLGDLLYIFVGFVVNEFLSFLLDGFRVGDSTSFLESLFVGLRVGNKEGLSTTRENTGLDSWLNAMRKKETNIWTMATVFQFMIKSMNQ